MIRYIIFLLAIVLPLKVFALGADEIVKRSQASFFYQGNDFKARVIMKLISKTGQERVRELTMLRKNYGEAGGNQKYFIYFFQPADVRDMTFMVYKYPARDDDRWLFVPSINLVQRIAARDSRSSFVGSDFTYEDVSGRDVESDTHKLLKEESLNGNDCYVIESVPKGSADYTKKITWVDKTNFLPLKEEYYNVQGELYRLFTADEIKDAGGLPTVAKRTMKNLKSGHRTEVLFKDTRYNLGLGDDLFSERNLRKPEQKWIQ